MGGAEDIVVMCDGFISRFNFPQALGEAISVLII